jgi:hypothetical protein
MKVRSLFAVALLAASPLLAATTMRVSSEVTVRNGFVPGLSSPDRLAAAATGNGNILLSWSERLSDERTQLFVEALRADGTPIAATRQAIKPSDLPESIAPRIALDGENLMLSWMDVNHDVSTGRVSSLRLSPDGQILDATPRQIAPSGSTLVDLVGSSTGFEVYWSANNMARSRYLSNGDFLGTDFPPTGVKHVVVAGDAVGRLNYFIPSSVTPGIVGVPAYLNIDVSFTTAGELTGSHRLMYEAGSAAIAPTLISSGNGFLLVWNQSEKSGITLRAIRFDASGKMLDDSAGFIIAAFESTFTSQPGATGIQGVWDGRHYVVIFEHADTPGDSDVRGAAISVDGSVDASFAVAATQENEVRPTIVATATGRSLVIYQVARGAESRIAARTLDTNATRPRVSRH